MQKFGQKNTFQEGQKIIIEESKGRTPILLVDVPGEKKGNVLMYGHLDKQPEMEGWDKDKGPWVPKIVNDKLYGRGGADDGYALFASLCALKTLQNSGSQIPRVLVFIEFCEESGSRTCHIICNYSRRLSVVQT